MTSQYLQTNDLWLVEKKHLAAEGRIELPLDNAQGTDTYCWRPEEVRAMLEHCRGRPALAWPAGFILALATTGLRISELIGLQ